MIKNYRGNEKILIASACIVLIALFSFYYLSVNSSSRNKTSEEDTQDTTGEQETVKEESATNNESQTVLNEEEKTILLESAKIEYTITGLNKKDGDVFSIPDNITFTITPAVDKSKVTLTKDDGPVLYTGEGSGSEVSFTVYPAGKLAEGTGGTLLIEGFIGSEAVVSQKIKVVF